MGYTFFSPDAAVGGTIFDADQMLLLLFLQRLFLNLCGQAARLPLFCSSPLCRIA